VYESSLELRMRSLFWMRDAMALERNGIRAFEVEQFAWIAFTTDIYSDLAGRLEYTE